jgi:3' terminal RNA ribose 2'-O-methyltransferase Hen1
VLLTITTTNPPARDLGFLLHKHPDRVQSFELAFGTGRVFYPEASDERCTACLLVDVDPIDLARGKRGQAFSGEHYVNDRPYAASSFLSVAISEIYGTALAGRCESRPELASTPIALSAHLPVVPCRGGEELLRRLFEPLGYMLAVQQHPLDECFPAWGTSPYFSVELAGEVRLSELLAHLYVLLPVLDDDKHYWVGDAEVEKLLRRGAGWLDNHPARAEITNRYLRRRRPLVRDALARLQTVEEATLDDDDMHLPTEREQSLHEQRLGAVVAALRRSGARSVLDLGCGEGRLLRLLQQESQFTRITGLDASHRALDRAERRLRLDLAGGQQRERIRLVHGALTYRDARLRGFDAAAIVEVIEHLDPERLPAFERVVFEDARPITVVLTTPNWEYNALFDAPRDLRHADHRFEWTRPEFASWVDQVSRTFGYRTAILPVGAEDPAAGPPSQLAIFSLGESGPEA